MQPDTTPDLECEWCGRSMSRHMRAYYFGFDPTGAPAIDRILCSVAAAGKGHHHTERWTEAEEGEESCVALIQRAANEAAKAVEAAARERDELRAKVDRLVSRGIEDLRHESDELRARADEAEGNLASLADALNVGARENGLREVERYRDLDEMRGAVDALAINLGHARAQLGAANERVKKAEARAKELEVMLKEGAKTLSFYGAHNQAEQFRAALAQKEPKP